MSLAETFDELGALTWGDLTASEKREAVTGQLTAGRSAEEAAEQLTVLYGPIGVNQVRGVMDRHRLHERDDVRTARAEREDMERQARASRARRARPQRAAPEPTLPAVPAPRLGNARKKARITIFDLKPWQCKTPLWDGKTEGLENKFYCGNRALEGKTCCASCAQDLHQPPEARAASGTIYRDYRPKTARRFR